MKRTILALSLCLSLGCSSESSIEIAQGGSLAPVVTGIHVTNDSGPELVATWGNPLYPSFVDTSRHYVPKPGEVRPHFDVGYAIENPYPNPTTFVTRFTFYLPERGIARAWVTPASVAGTLDIGQTNGMITPATVSPQKIRDLMDEELNPGSYAIAWDAADSTGKAVPPGFYRIYVQLKDKLFWRDVCVYKDASSLPQSLRKYVR